MSALRLISVRSLCGGSRLIHEIAAAASFALFRSSVQAGSLMRLGMNGCLELGAAYCLDFCDGSYVFWGPTIPERLLIQMDWRLGTTWLLLGAVWVSSMFPETVQAAGKRYALVVGVKKYLRTQPLPELSFTENDANDLAAVLKSSGYDVTLMTQAVARNEGSEDYAPTCTYIRTQLDALLTNPNLTEDDLVLVALAGHGVQYEFEQGDQKLPRFYFCPADANVAGIKSANEISSKNELLDLAEVYEYLSASKAGGKLLLVDACRNDPSKPSVSRSASSLTLPPLSPPPGGIAAFFSCSAHQRAFEDQDLQHGVFFHQVIEALKGDADVGNAKFPADGVVTLSELSGHVSASTYDFVRRKFHGAKQAPEMKGEFRLSIPLLTLSKENVAAKPGNPKPNVPISAPSNPRNSPGPMPPAPEKVTRNLATVAQTLELFRTLKSGEKPTPNSIRIGLWIGGPLTEKNIADLKSLSVSALAISAVTISRVDPSVAGDWPDRDLLSSSLQSLKQGNTWRIYDDGRKMIEQKDVDCVVFAGCLNSKSNLSAAFSPLSPLASSQEAQSLFAVSAMEAGKDVLVFEDIKKWNYGLGQSSQIEIDPVSVSKKYHRICWYVGKSMESRVKSFVECVLTRKEGVGQID